MGHLALAGMLALFGAYVAVHSPIRRLAAVALGRTSEACYFTCQTAFLPEGSAESIAAAGLVVAAALAGVCLASGFQEAEYDKPLVFGIASLALLTVPAAFLGGLASAIGVPLLRPPLGPVLAAIPALVILTARVARGWRPGWHAWRVPSSQALRCLGGLGCALLGASVVLATLHPPTGWDPLSYHAPLAVYFWRDGDLTTFLDRAPDYAAWAHPGTIELWFGLLRIIGGERLADLGQLPFALLGACAVAAFARRLGLRQGASALAGSVFLIAPLVVGQVEQQLNDVAAASLLMATVALAAAPRLPWTRRRLVVLALGLGLMAASKLVLIPSIAALVVIVVVSACRSREGWLGGRTAVIRVVLVGIFALLVVSPWWTRNVVRFHNPLYPAAIAALGLSGLDQTTLSPRDTQYVGRGDTFGLPSGVAWLLYPLLESHTDQSGLGALMVVAALPGLVIGATRFRGRPFAVFGITTAATLVGWWTFTRHDPRFLLGVSGLSFAFVPCLLLGVPRPQRRLATVLIVVTGLFSAAVTVDQVLFLVASFPQDRPAYYEHVWGLDPAVEGLPESEPLVFDRGDVRNADSLDYPLLGRFQRRLLVVLPHTPAEQSTDSIVQRMRSLGARYAYAIVEDASLATQVEARFGPARFELVHFSTVGVVDKRCCFEVRTPGDQVRRYLFRLLP